MNDKFKQQWIREASVQPGLMLDVISLDTQELIEATKN